MSGLAGHSAAHMAIVWYVAAGIALAVLVVLVIIYRRAAARHELEEAERVLEERFRD